MKMFLLSNHIRAAHLWVRTLCFAAIRRFETFQCQEFNQNNICKHVKKSESCFHNVLRNIAPNLRQTLWMKSLAQWACAPKTPKTHPESKNPASFRFETTYLDVLDALNHEKAMIHNPLIWFYNNFRNSWSILPKTKILVEKCLSRTERFLTKAFEICCRKSYLQIICLTNLQDSKENH